MFMMEYINILFVALVVIGAVFGFIEVIHQKLYRFGITFSKDNTASKKISINNTVKGDYAHPNCFSTGHVLHPEKTGILKNKKQNPFEL